MERPNTTSRFYIAADQIGNNLIPFVENDRINIG